LEPEIPKIYSPETIEPQWARQWVEQNLYRPADDPVSPRFSLTIPPPNITGSLHMGHMLEHTEIDILMRWHRMKGENVLWLPGTDHASIATQMIVERELGRQALPGLEPGPSAQSAWQREGQRRRREMGREKFIERCWLWKEENGGTIREQMKRLGASCDWTRDRFTMDPAYTRAVVEVFVRLYEEGLIYRGKYIVNWCPRCGTAVSDLEVVHEERQGKLWYIRYPIEGGSGHLTVATTRPETMLGDTAVAVNPSDPRYRETVGYRVELPLLKRFIPVVADDFVDPKFGTGAVKVTPAHDPNDFEIAERHKLPRIEVINEEGRMTDEAGPYRGLDRFEARNAVVKDLTAQGLVEKIEDHPLSVGICQRCHSVVEPRLSTQWFMKMKPLAEPAIRAVEDGRIQVVPDQYRKIYLDWMGKIYDWCISRQLWWGHRIPAWYCLSCSAVMVARHVPPACTKCGSTSLRPETDVLDTWFSSALWPFATLGWPDDTADLRRFFPQNLMIMGFDILFFWGARMIMMGMKFMNEVPFRELYIHALVRDAERQKMSKTKGNVIDPLEITEKYGTDAVRFALAISAAPGTDIVVSPEKFDSYRAFANKIWNAARFVLMNYRKLPEKVQHQIADALKPMPGLGFDAVAGPEKLALADRWIFSRLLATTGEVDEALGQYRFHEAADKVYHFFWHELCDWYLEWVKPEITQTAAEPAQATWINLTRVFEAALHLLHPFMPFITEELWHGLSPRPREESISHAAFNLVSERVADPISEKQFQTIQELIVAVRNAKAELSLQKQRPSVQVACEDLRVLELFRAHLDAIHRLAGIEATNFTRGRMTGETAGVHHTATFDLRILHEEKVDPAAEHLRLEREKERLEQALAQSKKQLDNQNFMDRAPRDVVRGVERRNAELTEHHRKVLESLERLGRK
jgi:valyl-tRNA synthetase